MPAANKKPLKAPEPGEGAQTILNVAKSLFAAQGYDGVSINEIARQSGVSKANVFHHFSSKEHLYLTVLKTACEETVGSLANAHITKESSKNRPLDDLWQFFSSQQKALLNNESSAKLVLRSIMESKGERGRVLAQQVVEEFFNRLVSMVNEGQDCGALRKDFDPALLAYLMLGANVFYFENHKITSLLEQGQFAQSPERYAREAFRLLLRGVQET